MILKREMRTARFVRLAGNVPVLRKNLDYGEGINKKLDEVREDNAKDGVNLINPIDSAEYCEKDDNVEYWKEMGDSPAAKDFQKYIKEVKCSDD